MPSCRGIISCELFAAVTAVAAAAAAAILPMLQVLEDSKITMSMIQASRYVAGIKCVYTPSIMFVAIRFTNVSGVFLLCIVALLLVVEIYLQLQPGTFTPLLLHALI